VGFKETLERMKQYLSTHKKPEGENWEEELPAAFGLAALIFPLPTFISMQTGR